MKQAHKARKISHLMEVIQKNGSESEDEVKQGDKSSQIFELIQKQDSELKDEMKQSHKTRKISHLMEVIQKNGSEVRSIARQSTKIKKKSDVKELIDLQHEHEEEIKTIRNRTSSESVRKLDKNIVSRSANEHKRQTYLRELEEDNKKLLKVCEKDKVKNFVENCDIRLSNKDTDLRTSLDSPDQANNDVAKQTNIKSQKKTFRLFNIDSTSLYDALPGSFAQKKIYLNTGLIENKNNSNVRT
ncbi:hypothetical protein X975_21515, partial [Stegodyphus mimosarum]